MPILPARAPTVRRATRTVGDALNQSLILLVIQIMHGTSTMARLLATCTVAIAKISLPLALQRRQNVICVKFHFVVSVSKVVA
jgi:hypothetical protein